jgi:hypothetical protein
VAEFVRRFERPRLPVVVTGLCEEWPAAERWAVDRLLERFGDHKFKARVDVPWAGCAESPLGPAPEDARKIYMLHADLQHLLCRDASHTSCCWSIRSRLDTLHGKCSTCVL